METTSASGKVALVTGSAMGIGLACAEAFAKAGYITVLADIKEPAEQATKLAAEGCKAVAYRCDVSDTQEVRKMIDWIVSAYGRLDAALNNAGIQTPQRPMAEITDDEFDRTVAVDLKGVWNCMRYEILQMLKQGGGAGLAPPNLIRSIGGAVDFQRVGNLFLRKTGANPNILQLFPGFLIAHRHPPLPKQKFPPFFTIISLFFVCRVICEYFAHAPRKGLGGANFREAPSLFFLHNRGKRKKT